MSGVWHRRAMPPTSRLFDTGAGVRILSAVVNAFEAAGGGWRLRHRRGLPRKSAATLVRAATRQLCRGRQSRTAATRSRRAHRKTEHERSRVGGSSRFPWLPQSRSKETATMPRNSGRVKCLMRKQLLGHVSEGHVGVSRGRDFSLPGSGSMVREFGNIRAGMCTILLTKSRAGLIVLPSQPQFNTLELRFPGEGL